MSEIEVRAQGDTVQIILGPGEKSRKYKGDTITYPRLKGLILDKYNRTITFSDGEVWSISYFAEHDNWPGDKLYPFVDKVGEKLKPFYFLDKKEEKTFDTWKKEYYKSHSINSKESKEYHAKMQPYYDKQDARQDAWDVVYEVSNLMRCEEDYVLRECFDLKPGDQNETGLVIAVVERSISARDITFRLPDGTEKTMYCIGCWGTKVKKLS